MNYPQDSFGFCIQHSLKQVQCIMLLYFFFVFWCFTGVKHLGTCDLSGLKPLYWLNQVTRIPADPAKILRIFSLQNPHTFSKKTFSRQILRFLTNFEARYIHFEDWFRKKTSGALLLIVSRFQIFFQKSVSMMLNWLLFFCVKIAPEFQRFPALARVPKQTWPSVGMI